jgi:hypothetical protein
MRGESVDRLVRGVFTEDAVLNHRKCEYENDLDVIVSDAIVHFQSLA